MKQQVALLIAAILGASIMDAAPACAQSSTTGATLETSVIANAGTTGTTINTLAKINSSGNAVITATTDTDGAIGIVLSNAGTTGSAQIARGGIAKCAFDGTATDAHFVQISSSTAGNCHDAGSTRPTSGQVIGYVLAGGSGAATYTVVLNINGPSPLGTQTIASGASAMGTGAISSAACATVVTATATGVATTDAIIASFNADPTAVTGYIPSTSGMLTIIAYPTSNNVNFKVCNNTAGSITPGAVTINWRVVR